MIIIERRKRRKVKDTNQKNMEKSRLGTQSAQKTLNRRGLKTVTYGSSMDQVWIKYGSSIDQVWIKYGSSMDQVCIKYGSSMD